MSVQNLFTLIISELVNKSKYDAINPNPSFAYENLLENRKTILFGWLVVEPLHFVLLIMMIELDVWLRHIMAVPSLARWRTKLHVIRTTAQIDTCINKCCLPCFKVFFGESSWYALVVKKSRSAVWLWVVNYAKWCSFIPTMIAQTHSAMWWYKSHIGSQH